MIQFATPIAPDIPVCGHGHRPQFVETRGAPPSRSTAAECPTFVHYECAICGVATVPHTSRAVAESRWRDTASPHRVPLYLLREARAQAFALHRAA